jgi:hypothetical protein
VAGKLAQRHAAAERRREKPCVGWKHFRQQFSMVEQLREWGRKPHNSRKFVSDIYLPNAPK